jgi:hypothetical protein
MVELWSLLHMGTSSSNKWWLAFSLLAGPEAQVKYACLVLFVSNY